MTSSQNELSHAALRFVADNPKQIYPGWAYPGIGPDVFEHLVSIRLIEVCNGAFALTVEGKHDLAEENRRLADKRRR